jgi:hypothetical protein
VAQRVDEIRWAVRITTLFMPASGAKARNGRLFGLWPVNSASHKWMFLRIKWSYKTLLLRTVAASAAKRKEQRAT